MDTDEKRPTPTLSTRLGSWIKRKVYCLAGNSRHRSDRCAGCGPCGAHKQKTDADGVEALDSDVKDSLLAIELSKPGYVDKETTMRMKEDYDDEVTLCPPPIFLLLISALEIGLYATQDGLELTDSQLIYNPCKRQQAWPRYMVYIFAHRDIAHLAGNIVAQVGSSITFTLATLCSCYCIV